MFTCWVELPLSAFEFIFPFCPQRGQRVATEDWGIILLQQWDSYKSERIKLLPCDSQWISYLSASFPPSFVFSCCPSNSLCPSRIPSDYKRLQKKDPVTICHLIHHLLLRAFIPPICLWSIFSCSFRSFEVFKLLFRSCLSSASLTFPVSILWTHAWHKTLHRTLKAQLIILMENWDLTSMHNNLLNLCLCV